MNYNNPQLMASVGMSTPQTVIYKSESHKLCQAFPVKEGETIIQGQPVALEADGTISGYLGDTTQVYLGIAITNSEYPAYPPAPAGVEVTVMVSGFSVVYGLANAALNAGFVTPVSVSEDSPYVYYKQVEQVTVPAQNQPLPVAENRFIALNKATAKDDLIQIIVK